MDHCQGRAGRPDTLSQSEGLSNVVSQSEARRVSEAQPWLQEEEDGDVITCKAGIPDLDQSTLQTSWNLQVNCEFLKTRLFSKIRGYDYSELLGN